MSALKKNIPGGPIILLSIIIVPLVWLFATQEQTPNHSTYKPEAAAPTAQAQDPEKAKDLAALALNLNKFLCAKVVDIRVLQINPNVHEVTCIEYRGGSAQKVYHLDINTGKAWIP